jgi:hypothetical protein
MGEVLTVKEGIIAARVLVPVLTIVTNPEDRCARRHWE